MGRYEGKTAVVTGGTSGIGLGTARHLIQEGARVLVTGRSAKTIEVARKELGDFGITRRKIDARLQLRLEEVPRWNLYGRSTAAVSFRPQLR